MSTSSTTANISTMMANMASYPHNPGLIQRDIFNHLDYVMDGTIDIVDPSNPFVFSLEAACVTTAFHNSMMEASMRKLYASLAQTSSELYHHMSDKDYLDRFAQPSKVTMQVMLRKSELLTKMVEDTDNGYYKLVIPRNSFVGISDTVFSLQYPIEIRKLSHGGLQVVYNTDKTSPLQTLATNIIDWEIRNYNDIEWLWFSFPMYQFEVSSYTWSVSAASGFKETVTVSNQFYYARAWLEESDGSWSEIKATHSDQIYDVTDPTVCLTVIENVDDDDTLKIIIPQIYLTNGTISTRIRLDVYQTQGDISLDLGSYPATSVSTTWQTIDTVLDDTTFSAPLNSFKDILVYSESTTSGGADAMTFDELRAQVIKNQIGDPDVPITPAQIEGVITRKGYTIVQSIDNLTDRAYLATRELPAPTNEKLITAAASTIQTVTFTIDEAILNDYVLDNTDSITITPSALFKLTSGMVKPVTASEISALAALSVEERAIAVNNKSYFYTPFHYVYDFSDSSSAARAYYLNAPEVVSRSFVKTNASTALECGTGSASIEKTSTGYTLTVITNTSDETKELADSEIHAQLGYIPEGESDMAYLLGTCIGRSEDDEEFIFTFDIKTNLKIDSDDLLITSNFQMYTADDKDTSTTLTNTFDILYSTSAVMPTGYEADETDDVLGFFQLPSGTVAITHETIKLKFGSALDNLWCRSRTVVSSAVYKTYSTDVYRRYEEDVYETDEITGSTIKLVSGKPTRVLLHSKGDVIYDAAGKPTYEHKEGEVIYDASGSPIIANERGMTRQLDVLLIEGAYWFATDSVASDYRDEIIDTLLARILDEMSDLEDMALERTGIYYYPKATIGSVSCMVQNGKTTSLEAAQGFTMDMYVPSATYNSTALKTALKKKAINIISTALAESQISHSAIVKNLGTTFGEDVYSFELTKLADDTYSVVTLLDDASRFCIGKRLTANTDGTLSVEEDITFNWINHSKSSS